VKGGVGEKKKNKRVTWLEGLSCLDEVQLVAEEALVEETVIDAGRGKKEKPSAGRKKEKLTEKREKLVVAIMLLARSWVGGEG